MSIRRSAAAAISELVDQLGSDDPARQESAVARLMVIGDRACGALLTTCGSPKAPDVVRALALRTLAELGDRRAARLAETAAGGQADRLALEAIAILRQEAAGRGRSATAAFETLTSVALDGNLPVERRLAAVAALEDHPAPLVQPVFEALAHDTASGVVAGIARSRPGIVQSFEAFLGDPTHPDPEIVAVMIDEHGATERLTTLRRTIDVIGQLEATDPVRKAAWRRVRGRLHEVLAARGSRLALYDLRETLARSPGPLPVGFAIAAGRVGNADCIEAIGRAWLATSPDDRWWRDHLADAFEQVVRREDLSRAHPAMRRLLAASPAAALLVARAPVRAAGSGGAGSRRRGGLHRGRRQ